MALSPTPLPGSSLNIIDILRETALIGAFCYLIGFLIIRFHLSRFDIYQVSISPGRYISLGILFLAIIIVPAIPLVLFNSLFTSGTTINWLEVILRCLFALILYNFIMKFIGIDFNIWKHLFFVPIFIKNWFWSEFAIWLIINFLFVATSIPSTNKTAIYTITVVLSIFFTKGFSYNVYPLISATIGGGYPTEINLLFHADKIDETQIELFEKTIKNKICLDSNNNSKVKTCKTQKLILLEELDKSYIVLAKNQNTCLNGSSREITKFLKNNYTSHKISKDLIQSVEYSAGGLDSECEKEEQIQTVLMFEAKDKDKKDFDFVVRIFRQKDQKNKFFMNLYNKSIQIVEIKNKRVEKSLENNRKINNKWEVYTYKSSNKNLTKYSRVVAKVNRQQNQSILEIFIPNINKNAHNQNKKNLLEIDGCNIVLEPDKLDNFIKEKNIANSYMVSYPKMYSSNNTLCPVNDLRVIVSKDDFAPKNLLRKKDRYNSIRNIIPFIQDLDSDLLIVKDQVQSLGDMHIWYNLFYSKLDDNISFTTGWTQKK